MSAPSPFPTPPQYRSPSPSTSPRCRVLVLAGPTAVGKSSTAINLVSRLPSSEIISADSVQVYTSLSTGSNKPSPAERSAVPHHLLDVVPSLSAPFSAGSYFTAARSAIDDTATRGPPLVVGGTMMYLRWLIHGRPATPPPDPEVVARVDEAVDALAGDWPTTLALLAKTDAARAAALSENDWYRLRRALQVAESTGGKGVSGVPLEGGAPRARECKPENLDHDFRCFFLYDDRVVLNRRIDRRCENMVLPVICRSKEDPEVLEFDAESSVLVEVANLISSRRLTTRDSSAARAIGYRQTIQYLLSCARVVSVESSSDNSTVGESALLTSFRAFMEDFLQATRGYAKQQLSWFRKEPGFIWIRANESAVETIEHLYSLNESDYAAVVAEMKEEQDAVRKSMVAQGKSMKTYTSTREVLREGSVAEAAAVSLVESCAREIAEALSLDEIDKLWFEPVEDVSEMQSKVRTS
jgi:tRNA dimethylallyltransferase